MQDLETRLHPLYERRMPEYGIGSIWTEEGWWPLLLKLDEDIAKIDPNYKIAQVKEKFGGLRYYIHHGDELTEDAYLAIEQLIREAEKESLKTCEACGETEGVETRGSRTSRWLKTYCKFHHMYKDIRWSS